MSDSLGDSRATFPVVLGRKLFCDVILSFVCVLEVVGHSGFTIVLTKTVTKVAACSLKWGKARRRIILAKCW